MLIHDVMRQNIDALTSEILKDGKIILKKKNISIYESSDEITTGATFTFFENDTLKEVSAFGHGFVDAICEGLLGHYSEEFCSLRQIKLRNFSIAMKFNDHLGTAAASNVVLEFCVNKNNISFSDVSDSIVGSAYENLLKVFEFYINCEKCFLLLRKCALDAELRNRADIVASCSYKMSKLTKMVSYEFLC